MSEFINALFQPNDLIIIRPIEVWNGEHRKESRVDYRGIEYLTPDQLQDKFFDLLERSAEYRTNLFFGVCPRHDLGQYDKSWQIRIVRHLWADMDDITTLEEADACCAAAGVPPASIVVHSGNGIHLYWLLLEPITITDAGEPIPVEVEWLPPTIPGGKKRRNEYVMKEGEKLPLASRHNIPQLSPQATEVQHTLQGLAAALGADHTTDLARVLRLPGTMNRKNERNGETPKPCKMLRCDADATYRFDQFSFLAQGAPEKLRSEQVKQYHMPSSKRLNRHSKDTKSKVKDMAFDCGTVSPGQRSEADFSICCFAIRRGIDMQDVWELVESRGKFAEFAERGRPYFDSTWSKAYDEVQEERFETYEKKREDSCEADESDPGLIRLLADHICDTNHFAVDASDRLYRFVVGRFIPFAEKYIRRMVKKTCIDTGNSRKWRGGLCDEVVNYIKADAPELWDRPPMDTINVLNGLLDLHTLELRPHSPDFLSPVQLGVSYDPDAKCPNIDKFISEIFPEDAFDLALEIAANLMTADTSIQKAILLLGSGGNGKSVYLRLVTALIGTANVSVKPLQNLESERFALGELYGKLANICSDLPGESMRGTSVFKSVTGGDMLSGEYKFSLIAGWWCPWTYPSEAPGKRSRLRNSTLCSSTPPNSQVGSTSCWRLTPDSKPKQASASHRVPWRLASSSRPRPIPWRHGSTSTPWMTRIVPPTVQTCYSK